MYIGLMIMKVIIINILAELHSTVKVPISNRYYSLRKNTSGFIFLSYFLI